MKNLAQYWLNGNSKIIDISLPIEKDIVVYPGDVKFSCAPVCTIERSGCNMMELNIGTHTGTHIDAPFHFIRHGDHIDDIPLDVFIGNTQVIEIQEDKITTQQIENVLIPEVDRVIFKTKNSYLWDKKTFSKKYVHLTEDGADTLIKKNIRLVGIDYVSIERFGTPDFKVHKKLLSNNIPILEGLNLREVDPGLYFLIALPLKLKGLDGSPARAVLIQKQTC